MVHWSFSFSAFGLEEPQPQDLAPQINWTASEGFHGPRTATDGHGPISSQQQCPLGCCAGPAAPKSLPLWLLSRAAQEVPWRFASDSGKGCCFCYLVLVRFVPHFALKNAYLANACMMLLKLSEEVGRVSRVSAFAGSHLQHLADANKKQW